MATKPPLVTKWGGKPPSHSPLVITNPANPESDLVLTSEVLVQSFLSLQKHEYTYRIDNGTKVNVLRVEWKAPEIKLERAAKGETPISVQSFFSPQLTKTTASAHAVPDGTAFAGRESQNERADAYVPWTSAIGKTLKELLGEAISKKITLSNVASVAISGGAIVAVTSQLARADSGFEYKLFVENRGSNAVKVDIAGLQFGNQSAQFELGPLQDKVLELRTSDLPVERKVLLKIAEECEFPIYVLVADSMIENKGKTRIVEAPAKESARTTKTIEEKKKEPVIA